MRALLALVLLSAAACGDDDTPVDPPLPPSPTDGGAAVDTGQPPPRDAAVRPPPVANADFATRCAAEGVVRCVGFDEDTDLGGVWGDRVGTTAGDVPPSIDYTVFASGGGSLLFTTESNTGSSGAGSWFANFSDDLSVQFAENDTFYLQWRQRFSPEMINTYFEGGGGWKQIIISTGDRPGCSASAAQSIDSGGNCATSCTALELVVQNSQQRGFPQMYNSCTGSASHGPYNPFEEGFESYDFKLQNARAAPYCLYSQSDSSYFPPEGNCLGYVPDAWMTFQVEVTTGPRVGDEWVDSYIRLWVGYEGQPSELAVDWGPYALTAGDPAVEERLGKIWLLPYHTGKEASQSHPTAYTWYDELIVSTEPIADP